MAAGQLEKLSVYSRESDPLAQQLAIELGLPLVTDMPDSGLVLAYDDLGLHIFPANGRSGPVRVDYTAGKSRHRRLYGGGKGQQIAKAIGVQGAIRPRVLDVTAGLGEDAFVLASLGCQVQLVERQPIVRALLADGLSRLQADKDLAQLGRRLQLLPGNAEQVMQCWVAEPLPQVVYLDPMFPHTGKSAQVKKEMALFRTLVGADLDADLLLAPALALATHRVVVKRPRLAPVLAAQEPTYKLTGKANRFDIYVKASFNANSQSF
ncbi:MAG: class I SAM-dependent methyltransferase [Gammaproteobacteria bacterium]|jgi:16S rRNA (guanine1516-N2)-methyltransferase|nr:class I SAM-dependent methyltransferase [Gammaproteobacteria bacterium]